MGEFEHHEDETTGSIGGGAGGSPSPGAFKLGGQADQLWTGPICEVRLYEGYVSAAGIAAVMGALKAMWGGTPQCLPRDHKSGRILSCAANQILIRCRRCR